MLNRRTVCKGMHMEPHAACSTHQHVPSLVWPSTLGRRSSQPNSTVTMSLSMQQLQQQLRPDVNDATGDLQLPAG